jgi:glycosyltransferase involved in cell wall biosynthesis
MTTAILSIVMPVYNREKYIGISVKSILTQTFSDFEFIIVNDGSTDKTEEIIKNFNDERIILLNNEQNKGIVYSRNKGLSVARGKYIGMFDSDDIAYPQKFEEQIMFLRKNPDFGMVGSWVKHIDENGNTLKTKWKLKAKPKFIPAIMLFRNYFVQSTVVIRKEAIPVGGYSKGFDVVEDSKMWFEVSLKYKVANLQKYLLHYRVHSGNASEPENEQMDPNLTKLFRYIFRKLEIEMTEDEIRIHYLIKNREEITSFADLVLIEHWLLKILQKNKKLKKFEQCILRNVIFNRWLKACYKARRLNMKLLGKMLFSPLSRYIFCFHIRN